MTKTTRTSSLTEERQRSGSPIDHPLRGRRPTRCKRTGPASAPRAQGGSQRALPFWVDAGLSYMLESTDVDIAGRDLRTPFPSFAFVFTDRHALSFGERQLARRANDPLQGQILRVMTVYQTERRTGQGRSIRVVFALDALGADLPSLVDFELPADDEQSLRAFLESVSSRALVQPNVPDHRLCIEKTHSNAVPELSKSCPINCPTVPQSQTSRPN